MKPVAQVIHGWTLDTFSPGMLRCVFSHGENSRSALLFNTFDEKWLTAFLTYGVPVDDWEYSLDQGRMVCKGHVYTLLFHPEDFWRFFDDVKAWFATEGTLDA